MKQSRLHCCYHSLRYSQYVNALRYVLVWFTKHFRQYHGQNVWYHSSVTESGLYNEAPVDQLAVLAVAMTFIGAALSHMKKVYQYTSSC